MARHDRFNGNAAHARRLHLEQLEDRRMLAVFTVTNLYNSGVGSLRNAIAAANVTAVADTIEFALGVEGTINLTGVEPLITQSLTINGPGAEKLTVSAGNGPDGIFNTGDGRPVFSTYGPFPNIADVVISGLTITGGDASGFTEGGGIHVTSLSNLTLVDSVVSGNAAVEGGGGISNNFENYITVIRSTISGNVSGEDGGGIAMRYGSNLTITDSTISGNTAGRVGGGIWALENNGSVINLVVSRSTISGNTAQAGGGIYTYTNTSILIESSTITDNTATHYFLLDSSSSGSGGGIVSLYAERTITNSIIAGNHSISSNSFAHPERSTDIDDLGGLTTFNFNLVGVNPNGLVGTGNQFGTFANPLDPLLGPLADNGGPTHTYALLPGSPAIDVGNSSESTDQRGYARIADFPAVVNGAGSNASDVGAFELQNVTLSWDGGAGTTFAFDATNWDPDQLPSLFQVVDLDDVLLAPQTIDLAGRTLQLTRIEVDDAPDDYTFTNGTIEIFLSGGNALLTRPGGGTLTVDADILFGAGSVEPRFNVVGTGPPIVVTGNVAPSPGRTDAVTLEITSRDLVLPASVTVSGDISDGAGGSKLSLRAGFEPDSFNHRGVVVVTGDNTFSGTTTVNGAVLEFDSIANVDGTASALGAPTNATDGTIRLGAEDANQPAVPGTLRYVGSGHTSDRAIQLAGAGGVIESHASATGPLTFTGGVSPVASPEFDRTLEITGDSGFVNTLSGAIVNGGSNEIDLRKTGSTTWVLAGDNTYQRGTTVAAGTLLVNNTSGSGTGTNSVVVESGATLGGTGNIDGAVTVNDFARVSPGESIGTLTVDSISFGGANSELFIEVGDSGHDQLAIDGGSTTLGGQLLVDLVEGVPDNTDSFTIISSTGSLSGSFSNLLLLDRVATAGGEGSFLVTVDTTNDQVTLSDFQLDPLAGDYDGDNDVDGHDFLRWQRGQSTHPLSPVDLQVWETNYGNEAALVGPSVAAPSTSELIDAALALWLAEETTDAEELLVDDRLSPMTTGTDNTVENRPIASAEQPDDEFDIASSKSGEADDSEERGLAETLLDRVLG